MVLITNSTEYYLQKRLTKSSLTFLKDYDIESLGAFEYIINTFPKKSLKYSLCYNSSG